MRGPPGAGSDGGLRPAAGPGKRKARIVCQAFVDGAGGGRCTSRPPRSLDVGAAVFFGVTRADAPPVGSGAARDATGSILDNAYFDAVRGRMLRATRNAVQASGREPPDWGRWAALNIRIRPGAGKAATCC